MNATPSNQIKPGLNVRTRVNCWAMACVIVVPIFVLLDAISSWQMRWFYGCAIPLALAVRYLFEALIWSGRCLFLATGGAPPERIESQAWSRKTGRNCALFALSATALVACCIAGVSRMVTGEWFVMGATSMISLSVVIYATVLIHLCAGVPQGRYRFLVSR